MAIGTSFDIVEVFEQIFRFVQIGHVAIVEQAALAEFEVRGFMGHGCERVLFLELLKHFCVLIVSDQRWICITSFWHPGFSTKIAELMRTLQKNHKCLISFCEISSIRAYFVANDFNVLEFSFVLDVSFVKCQHRADILTVRNGTMNFGRISQNLEIFTDPKILFVYFRLLFDGGE